MKPYLCFIVVFVELFVAQEISYEGNSQELLYEGDACTTNTNELGICVRLQLCLNAENMFKKKVSPVNCGFVRNTPIVCCRKNETLHTYLAEERCAKYNQPVQAVLVGEDAKLKQFPPMAALGYSNNNKKVWLCGGTLISEDFVLTAAHCLVSLQYGSVKWVRLGIIDLSQPEDKDSNGQNFEVIKTIYHPLYKPPLVYNDIGLVQLNKKVYSGLFVKAACLNLEDTIPEDAKLLVTGWGLTKVGGNQSNILQFGSVDLFSKEECNLHYKPGTLSRKLKHGIQHEQQICAGGKKLGTDTCQGDSGGPLIFQKYISFVNRVYVVGVTSFGKSCGIVNVPGIYTRVSHYVPWIESVVWPDEI